MVEQLLADGEDPNHGSRYYEWTSLHFAVCIDNKQVLARLLSQPGINLEASCFDGGTPMHYAISHVNAFATDQLLKAGANTSDFADLVRTAALSDSYNRVPVLNLLLSLKPGAQESLKLLQAALFFGVERGHLDVVRCCLNTKSVPSEWKENALFRCWNAAALTLILENGVDPNCQEDDGDFPLHDVVRWWSVGAERGRSAVVETQGLA